jgi:NADPH:quinone reductase
VEEIAEPEPGPGEVVVAVKAVGLNFFDTLIIEGKYQYKPDLPFSPGAEIAGVVSALGRHVSGLRRGRPRHGLSVLGRLPRGSRWPTDKVVPMPEGIGFEAAAGLTVTYGTTMHACATGPISSPARPWWCWGRPAASARRPSRSARSWARG